MATTWIKPLHRTGSNSVSAALARAIDYAKSVIGTSGILTSQPCRI